MALLELSVLVIINLFLSHIDEEFDDMCLSEFNVNDGVLQEDKDKEQEDKEQEDKEQEDKDEEQSELEELELKLEQEELFLEQLPNWELFKHGIEILEILFEETFSEEYIDEL